MTKMFVEPRKIRDGGLTGCTGATMDTDGTVYRANRSGKMLVENPDHVRQMKASGHVVEGKFHGAGIGRRAICTSCAFGAYSFQKSAPCPRCGGVIKEEK